MALPHLQLDLGVLLYQNESTLTLSKKQQQERLRKQQKKLRQKLKKQCPQCQPGPECYRMLFGQYKFDVDLAREIVKDGRAWFELETEDVEHALKWAEIHRPHLQHINTKYPGIIAHYWYPSPEGEILHGHVLIDGHHRAAKLYESQQPFYVHILTEEESKRVAVRVPHASNQQSSSRA